MEEYTREQIQRADDTDLYVFLSGRGEQFKRCGKEYRWLRHDSVMINKNEWYRFSQNKGGHAIDFMKEFYGLSFAEAVKELLGEEGDRNKRTAKEDVGRQKVCPIPLPGLELPERNESCEIARKYLIEQRKLSEQLVNQMIAKGDIYESKNYHNVVFVGRDKEQNPRYAAMRGIDENRYRGEAKGSEKAYGFGYIGTDEKLFVFESPIDLLSYITAVPEEWEKHSYISLGGLSEKAMKRMYTEYPHIHSIYLCLDNDEPGNESCRQFVSLIPDGLSVYRLEPVKKDWNECLVAEVPVENMAKQMCWRDAREKPVPVMKMSEVEETVVQWLWYPFIPFGKVTLIQGNPGKGKTWLAMAIAAYCTNGKELPNALPIEPFNVLYQTAEDGIADTIKPRLAKCGADMTRVRFINEDEKQLSMTDDRIEKAIRQNNVRLMIMDPIQAYLGANVDMNRANEIRPLFRHLSTIAERTGCAIVLIGHLNKSSGSQSDYRSLGSIDIAAAVRSILFVEKVEKEKEQDIRVVYQQKDSLAKKENPVAFSLGEEGLTWLGEYDISIEDLLMGKAGTKKETKLEKAQKLILELLNKRKVMCLEELEAELLAYGISSRTGRDARKQLENRLSYDWCQGRKTVALITE
ncbi:AAA family ATPase [Mediterraneibacter gnavus]|uniref:AAA family ATPase n=3 Tax=Mediterraneibacter gnavus TaxID=33038 RepID=UPI00156EF8AD|nr:AAA family ATPase [Mediterraneibacter gnavus]NSI22280.1 AAA family ATPase [Mediterraneibacter gnavus]